MLEWRDLYQLTKDGQSESEKNLPGMVRGPTNLMRGVRSAWTAACRRTREVRSILIVSGGGFGVLSKMDGWCRVIRERRRRVEEAELVRC